MKNYTTHYCSIIALVTVFIFTLTGCTKKMFPNNSLEHLTRNTSTKHGAVIYPDGNIFYPDGSVRTTDGTVWPAGTYRKTLNTANNTGTVKSPSSSVNAPSEPLNKAKGQISSKVRVSKQSGKISNTSARTDANGRRHARKRGE